MKPKAWSKIIEEHGVRVRLYERGGRIWRAVVTGRTTTASGKVRAKEDRASLKHSDRTLAEKQALALCRALAEARLAGATQDSLTVAQLHAAYVRECGALLSPTRKKEVEKAFDLFRRHVGADFAVADLGPHQSHTYVAARQAGTLATTRGRHRKQKVRAATIAKELGVLHAALNWAATYRRNRRPLIAGNPLRGVPLPSDPNPARPVATRERYEKLVEQADGLDASGAFRTMLNVAWYTGRRLGSIVALRASDVLLTPGQVRQALAAAGREEYLATEWPAAIRWAAESDKEGVEWIVPIPPALVALLGDYIRARGMVGGAVLFHAQRDPSKPVSKETAYYWITQAEKRAGMPHQRRGGWHALRRAWATMRKHMPLQDVMAAGGWRDPASLQRAYQHADATTVRAVMELGT
jgi:integrase